MHLVATTEVGAAAPRWAPAAHAHAEPAAARAIAIDLARTTVVVVESRAGRADAPRVRHLGVVRLVAGDGVVLARRRLATTTGGGEALISHLLDELRAAAVAAPHLVVGLIQDAGDATWQALHHGLAQLAADRVITGWRETIDPGALRARLDRTLCVIEPGALAREDRLDPWHACLDAWDEAIDGVTALLAGADRQLRHLDDHRCRVRAATDRRRSRTAPRAR